MKQSIRFLCVEEPYFAAPSELDRKFGSACVVSLASAIANKIKKIEVMFAMIFQLLIRFRDPFKSSSVEMK